MSDNEEKEKTTEKMWKKIFKVIVGILGAIGCYAIGRRRTNNNNISNRIESVGNIIDESARLSETIRGQNELVGETIRSVESDVKSARESVGDSLELIGRIKKRNNLE